ncbi:MAG: ABC transporter permease [Janthinobacterium lividum]
MNLGESFRFALQGISANKARSALTMLGVLIGVASVIVLVSFGTGAGNAIRGQVSGLGANTLTITPSSGGGGGRGAGGEGAGTSTTDTGTQTRVAELTMADAQALQGSPLAPDVTAVAAIVSPASVVATYEGASHTIGTTNGTTANYLSIDNDTVASGRAFAEQDDTAHSRVALVGPTVAKDLAGGDGTTLLNQTVQLNGKSFVVVGILTAKGSSGFQDSDDRLLAPLSAVQDTLSGYGSIDVISAGATSADSVASATSEVEGILDARHGVTAADRDYSIFSAASFLSALGTITTLITVLLAAVASISLLVGGIGVMNIMLVTVTERTREIGLRKAIGAPQGVIIAQFMFEAVLLSMLGGLAGVVVGLLGSQIKISAVTPAIAPWSIFVSFGFSVAIGLIFGIYPARRAARLRPIDALRYE